MLKYQNRCVLIEHPSEFPDLPPRIEVVYADLETSSGDPRVSSFNPWRQCTAICAAFTWDDHPTVYCVPRSLFHLLTDALDRAHAWCNHNVKYDVHVMFNDVGYDFKGELIDTLTLAKLVDSDRTYKGGYGLGAMAKWLLDYDMDHTFDTIRPWLENNKGRSVNKDFGAIPIERLAYYNCDDVRCNRPIHQKLFALLPTETRGVWATERRLTRTLISAERRGMAIDVTLCKMHSMRSANRMLKYYAELKELLGYEINPKSNPDCYDLLVNRFGLPPIYKPGNKGASFDKAALKEYMLIPDAPHSLLDLLLKYRHEDTMSSLFWETFLDLHIDGVLHSDNNQCVRSGRLSCSTPNNQQFNEEARSVVKPREGHALVVHDYKNIEYRFIIHYIQNPRIIEIFANNPDTDFHQMMADEVGHALGISVNRKAAKILNLAMGYGMGKKKTTASLRTNADIVAAAGGNVGIAEEIGTRVYYAFHRRLPELGPHTRAAENAVIMRGYVRNEYGRRCHLPRDHARKAFNRVCQSHAADLIKERANALDEIRDNYGAHILALVHDEVVSEVPIECVDEYVKVSTEVLNQSSIPVRVPIRTDCGVSTDNWLAAKEAGK